jgi:nucleoside-diphosphate-sugar epimerase
MNQTVLVTGAAGYLASWVVQAMLNEGHTVHGTVRSLADGAKLQHLHGLANKHPGRLRLYKADLLQPHSFDDAIRGCSLVIHVASPYFIDKPKDVQRQLVDPAVQGTLNVLASVERETGVTRVVLTSSVVALYDDACDLALVSDHMVREGDVNPNTDAHHNSYAYSKTRAEQAAWAQQRQQQRWELVTIHPGAIFGPSLSSRADATSVDMAVQFLNGSFRTGVPRLTLGLVDVRDVALAHARAALSPQAKGRYIVVAQSLRLLEMAKLMHVQAAGLKNKLPRSEAPKWLMWLIAPWVGLERSYVARNVGFDIRFDNAGSRADLGLDYRSPEQTLNDQIAQIVVDGLVAA